MAEGGDFAVHQLGERDGAGDRFEDLLPFWFFAFDVGFVHGVDEDGFDFSTGELLAGTGQDDGVVVAWFAAVAGDDDVPYLRTLPGVGEIDEEHFVEATFAQELGWELADVVGGGDDEDGFLFFLHP